MGRNESGTTLEAIAALAEEIARSNPECADKAMQILNLARGLKHEPEFAAIEDAIDAGTEGSLSDTEVRNASLEVTRTIRDEP